VRTAAFAVPAALTIAVIAVSSSAPLIAYAEAPALAIAFWRNALGLVVIVPAALIRHRAQLLGLARPAGRRTLLVCVLAGLALAVHFGTWVPSAQMTSVATATALVSTMPVWSALIATLQGSRPQWATIAGIGVAVAGTALATGADLQVSTRAVTGDILALVGGLAAAVYAALGERARASLSTTVYTAVCYSTCALALLVVCLVFGVRLGGYPAAAWLAIVGLTAGPQLLGHSMLNFALHKVSATTVSVLMLLEIPGAALLGWLWLDQLPPRASWPGLLIVMLGVAVVVLGTARRSRVISTDLG